MIDESIRKILSEKESELYFKGLLRFMESTGIEFRGREMTWPIGLATYYCVYLDINRLTRFNDKMVFYVILHEIGHHKRISKVGKEYVINMLSIEDFELFSELVINEEIIADRYACQLFQRFNNMEFPRTATQQLHLEYKQTQYKYQLTQLFGFVNHSEENYITLLESFVV